MANQQQFNTKPEDVGRRLDKFLTVKMNDITRSQIQKMIVIGKVTVNNIKPTKHRFLKLGEKIVVDLDKKPRAIKNQTLPKLKIIEANNNYIIVDKPAGLVVHADQVHPLENTLAGQIIKRYPETKNIGEDPKRPGIVHRLDKNVSGVMVVARNQKSFQYLKNQFAKRQVQKEYYALVHGIIDKDHFKIDFPIARKKTGLMAALPQGSNGRTSQTIIKVLNLYKNYSLLSVALITGRTHQIKVHLNAYNHPIVGEKIYINKKFKKDPLQNSLKRPFLHAYHLSFTEINNKHVNYKSNLPPDLQNIIKQLI